MEILSCIFMIIGAIIGAGFASGKEVYLFFFNYGKYGICGFIASSILMGYAIYKTLKIIKKYDIRNYEELLNVIIGKAEIKNINFKIVLNFIVNVFLLITFFVMCAGFAAYFKQELGVNEVLSCLIISVFCYFVLGKNIKGILLLNSLLIPIIIAVLIILGIKSLSYEAFELKEIEYYGSWIFDAILYASYNSITLVSILIPIKEYIKSKKDILIISIVCSLIIAILSGVIFVLLLTIKDDIQSIELPIVYVAGTLGLAFKYLYGLIIIAAIVTTAISSGYGFLNNISKNKKQYKMYNTILCGSAIFVSILGFSNLVNNLYPIFGILGLFQLLFIIKSK